MELQNTGQTKIGIIICFMSKYLQLKQQLQLEKSIYYIRLLALQLKFWVI